jgi:hypothetical protein
VPSRLHRIYWSNSYADLKRQVSIRIQYEMMRFVQDRETLREVIQEALGGTTKEPEAAPESFDELAAIFADAGGAVHF